MSGFLNGLESYVRNLILGTDPGRPRNMFHYRAILGMCRSFHEHGILPVAGGYSDQNPLLLLAFERIEEVKHELAPRE